MVSKNEIDNSGGHMERKRKRKFILIYHIYFYASRLIISLFDVYFNEKVLFWNLSDQSDNGQCFYNILT